VASEYISTSDRNRSLMNVLHEKAGTGYKKGLGVLSTLVIQVCKESDTKKIAVQQSEFRDQMQKFLSEYGTKMNLKHSMLDTFHAHVKQSLTLDAEKYEIGERIRLDKLLIGLKPAGQSFRDISALQKTKPVVDQKILDAGKAYSDEYKKLRGLLLELCKENDSKQAVIKKTSFGKAWQAFLKKSGSTLKIKSSAFLFFCYQIRASINQDVKDFKNEFAKKIKKKLQGMMLV
jgi:hypothetical protein